MFLPHCVANAIERVGQPRTRGISQPPTDRYRSKPTPSRLSCASLQNCYDICSVDHKARGKAEVCGLHVLPCGIWRLTRTKLGGKG